MKRSNGDFLTDAERDALHRDIRANELPTSKLAAKYNVAKRTVSIHRAKIFGKNAGANIRAFTAKMCLFRTCLKARAHNSRFCDEHKPEPYVAPAIPHAAVKPEPFIRPIPKHRLMAGR